MKVVRVLQLRKLMGREFQVRGAAELKAHSAVLVRVRGVASIDVSADDRKVREEVRSTNSSARYCGARVERVVYVSIASLNVTLSRTVSQCSLFLAASRVDNNKG